MYLMNILLGTLRTIAATLLDPQLTIILMILAVLLYRQNKKTTIMQKMIIGDSLNSAVELTISQIVIGIFAGVFGSLLLSFLGVAFDADSSIFLIFLVSIFFMFWKPRFTCFSYSGAILGFISLFLELISKVYAGVKINLLGTMINLSDVNVLKIDIGALITMIAVLHFVEGLLVIFDGKRGAIPVFTNKDDKIIGGFALRRNWVLPIALFFIVSNAGSLGATQNIATPNWWPLLKSSSILHMAKDAAVSMLAYYGVIGYSTITFTKDKEQKVISSGTSLLLYSLLIFILAQLAPLGYMYKLAIIVITPVAHELMLNLQRYLEVNGTPKYVSSDEGIMVLEVAPNSPAFEMGIKSGDLLVELNDRKIIDEQDILTAGKQGLTYISFKLQRGIGKLKEVSYNRLNSESRLGIVFVPKNIPGDNTVVRYDDNKFKDILDKLKKKDDDNLR
jgi:hypothetical protein